MRLSRVSILALFTVVGCGAGDSPRPDDDSMAPEPPAAGEQADALGAQCGDFAVYKNVYWGDLHTHTSYSIDAYTFGTRTDPAGAYAFAANPANVVNIASGAAPGQTKGQAAHIDRKLDFLAVTDHSEFFNADYGCTVDTSSPYWNSQYCVDIRNQGSMAQTAALAATLAQLASDTPSEPVVCTGGTANGGTQAQCAIEEQRAWDQERSATTNAYQRCSFTSLYAYEWTAQNGHEPGSNVPTNVHRNVIFGSATVPSTPIDFINYPSTHALWTALSQQCTGSCSALTIPHNSNVSGGQMFAVNDADVDLMMKYQTLAEIHQHKGSSECLSSADPSDDGYDPQCNFELLPGAKDLTADRPGYVRNGLKSGLAYYASSGSAKKNPLKLGIVGATDTHNATPGNVKEAGFPGHLGVIDDTPQLRVERCTDGTANCAAALENTNRDFNPGGITGVWAQQNTREDIYAALQAREVYATSGPRIKVRFYQYPAGQSPCTEATFPKQVVQAGGVPMGGTMGAIAAGAAWFVVQAAKDATAIAEIDIIKATIVGGVVKEFVYPQTPANTSLSCVTWNDTTFDPAVPTFYYARVIEQATARWSQSDCAAFQQSNPATWQALAPDCAAGGSLQRSIQERAWTSPIWNLP